MAKKNDIEEISLDYAFALKITEKIVPEHKKKKLIEIK